MSLSSGGLIKGFISAVIGLLLAMVGMDSVSSVRRLTFGFWQLDAGLDSLDVLMGLFALTEILTQVRTLNQRFNTIDPGRVRPAHTGYDEGGPAKQC